MAKGVIYNAQTKLTEIIDLQDIPQEPIPDMTQPLPTVEERLATLESDVDAVVNALAEVILI